MTEPPDEWWAESYSKGNVCVNFHDIYGKIEAIPATWVEDNIFELDATPLLVNGVSIEDVVEVEWKRGEATPYFVRVKEKSPYRTVRVELRPSEANNPRLREFVRRYCPNHRIEGGILAFSVFKDAAEVTAWLFDDFGLWGETTDAAEMGRDPK